MWYGKNDEYETTEEKNERRLKELEKEVKRLKNDDGFSMTSRYAGGGDDD